MQDPVWMEPTDYFGRDLKDLLTWPDCDSKISKAPYVATYPIQKCLRKPFVVNFRTVSKKLHLTVSFHHPVFGKTSAARNLICPLFGLKTLFAHLCTTESIATCIKTFARYGAYPFQFSYDVEFCDTGARWCCSACKNMKWHSNFRSTLVCFTSVENYCERHWHMFWLYQFDGLQRIKILELDAIWKCPTVNRSGIGNLSSKLDQGSKDKDKCYLEKHFRYLRKSNF